MGGAGDVEGRVPARATAVVELLLPERLPRGRIRTARSPLKELSGDEA